jgi:hypothetical protein
MAPDGFQCGAKPGSNFSISFLPQT